jgi:hypothetical protein
MHVRRLIDLAGLLASYGPSLVCCDERLSESSIEQYWTTSKVRLDRWGWNLKTVAQRPEPDAEQRRRQWPTTRGILEEILASEILTRVWTAILCAYDRQRGTADAEPVVRSVMIGHMEARHRVLTLMVRGTSIEAGAAIQLNHLRRRAEHWTDLLIGHLAERYDVAEFAVDPDRAREFANDLRGRGFSDRRQAWSLITASLQSAFQIGLSSVSPNPDLNLRIATSILSTFPSDVFDSTGLFRSPWLMRLGNTADDTHGMIQELLTEDTASEPHAVPPGPMMSNRNEMRLRRFGG